MVEMALLNDQLHGAKKQQRCMLPGELRKILVSTSPMTWMVMYWVAEHCGCRLDILTTFTFTTIYII